MTEEMRLFDYCSYLGCLVSSAVWRDARSFATVYQHGLNPEHRRSFTDIDLLYGQPILDWLDSIHEYARM